MQMVPTVAVALALAEIPSTMLVCRAHHDHGTKSASPITITITINPEARVSATLVAAVPSAFHCGTPLALSVEIINQGFVTGELQAELMDHPPVGATIAFAPEPLSGATEEMRTLRIVLTELGLRDLTVAFRLRDGSPDLGGRNRIHFLAQCSPT